MIVFLISNKTLEKDIFLFQPPQQEKIYTDKKEAIQQAVHVKIHF